MSRIEIFTDGSCSSINGAGGWAAVIVLDGTGSNPTSIEVLKGGKKRTSAHAMETTAVVEALEFMVSLEVPVMLYCDSKCLVDMMRHFMKTGEYTPNDQDRRLWKRLAPAIKSLDLKIKWVKRNTNSYNKLADLLAKHQTSIRKLLDAEDLHHVHGLVDKI